MDQICKNCVFGRDLSLEMIDLSANARVDIAKVKAEAKGKVQRREFVEKTINKYPDLKKMHGGFSMTQKPPDINGIYVACSNEEQLKREKATKEEIVHKYYFTCSSFKERKGDIE